MSIAAAIKKSFEDARQAVADFLADEENLKKVENFADMVAKVLERRGRVMICGNGGSYCDALHFAEEFTGRYRKDREALPVIALGEASHMSCVANDFGFEEVFSRQVQALGHEGDICIGISTSGNSANIIRALEQAKSQGMVTVGLLGKDGGKLKGVCDLEWVIPSETSDRVQEVHMCILHIAIEAVERRMFPGHYE